MHLLLVFCRQSIFAAAEKPVASMALCVEKFEVVTGSLVRVPNFYHTVSHLQHPHPTVLPSLMLFFLLLGVIRGLFLKCMSQP